MATESPQQAAGAPSQANPMNPDQVGFYMQTFGTFVKKFNLGGTVPLNELNLKSNKDSQGAELSESVQRKGHIEKSRQAKQHFFTDQNKQKLEDRLKSMS